MHDLTPAADGSALSAEDNKLVTLARSARARVGAVEGAAVRDQDGRTYACPYLADLETMYCDRGSGWACNEAGLLHIALSRSGEDLRRLDLAGAANPLRRGCELGFDAACRNLSSLKSGKDEFAAPPPTLEDFPVILRGSKGEIRESEPAALYALACHEGWPNTCEPSATTANGLP